MLMVFFSVNEVEVGTGLAIFYFAVNCSYFWQFINTFTILKKLSIAKHFFSVFQRYSAFSKSEISLRYAQTTRSLGLSQEPVKALYTGS